MGDKIIAFIEREGYEYFVQVPLFLGRIDFVGVRNSECLVIEGKVKDWKKAVAQALRYGYGAERTYVALPEPTARNTAKKHKVAFEKYGIGLIRVSERANVIIECEPKSPSFVFKQIILREVETRRNKSRERIGKLKDRCKNG